MPNLLGTIVNELAGTANWSWLMYPGLSHGAVKTIEIHGDPDPATKISPKLITGEWTGTMCLTESYGGGDLEAAADESGTTKGWKLRFVWY